MAIKIRNSGDVVAALVAHHLTFPVIEGAPAEEADARRAKVTQALREYSSYPGLIEIVSLLDGFDYNASLKKLTSGNSASLGIGHLVVPLKNENSHNYEIGAPALSKGSSSELMRKNGTTGNNLDTRPGAIRSATKEEAEAFYAALPKGVLQTLVTRALSQGILTFDLGDDTEAPTPDAAPEEEEEVEEEV